MYSLIQGDLEKDMEIQVTVTASGNNFEVGDTVELRWLKPDGTVTMVPLTIEDAVLGVVKRTWEEGDTDQVGIHFGQIVVTHATTAEVETFPNDGSHIIWNIYAQLS